MTHCDPAHERRSSGDQLVLTVDRGDIAVPPLLRALDAAGLALQSVQVNRPTLDDVFLTLTGRSLREDTDLTESEARMLTETWVVFPRQMRILLRNPVWVFFGLTQPILYLVLFGPLLKNVDRRRTRRRRTRGTSSCPACCCSSRSSAPGSPASASSRSCARASIDRQRVTPGTAGVADHGPHAHQRRHHRRAGGASWSLVAHPVRAAIRVVERRRRHRS